MFSPGAALGRYVIVELLGRGGMGTVYRATDRARAREVALKVLHAGAESAEDAVARVAREAGLAARFRHPCAVEVYDVGEADGVVYIEMELVVGESLRRYVGDRSVPTSARLAWIAAIGRVLAAAHARGVVHRDVKPENVMITRDGGVKVLDFGIAKHVAVDPSLSTTGAQLLSTASTGGGPAGTPLYMAPEQMRGDPVDARADQFAWGAVAYELLSGELPWGSRAGALQLLARLMSSEPAPLADHVADAPRYVSDAVQRALSKSPALRFPTMDAALAAFEGRRPSAPPSPLAPVHEGDEPAASAPHAATGDDGALPTSAPRSSPPRVRAALAAAIGAALAALTVVAVRAWTPASAPSRTAIAAKAEAPRCASHRACTEAAGAPSRCDPRAGCAPLGAPGCRVLADPEDVVDDDTTFFGAVLSIDGAAAWGLRDLQAMDLARRDFAQMMTSFRSGPAHGRVRRLGLVACDDGAGAAPAVHHLVDELHVPAIIGFSSGAELISLAGATLIPSGVMVVAPFTTSPLLTTIPRGAGQPRLIYRTTYDSADTARALGAAVPSIFEPELAKEGAIDGARPMRVALVRQSATRLSAFAGAFFGAVRFNGRSALENGASYREITYDAGDAARAAAGYAGVAAELARFAPHAVVYVGDDALVDGVIANVERTWSEPAFRPRWLAISVIPPSAARFAAGDPSRRRRFFGISEVTSGAPNARFVLHYNEVYPQPIARSGGPNSSYDAFYVLAYATYAVGDGDVTGESLARALPRLSTPGKAIDVGAAGIFDAFSTLRGGGAIDLDGAASRLDFDPETGDVPVDQALLCLSDPPRGAVPESVESGVVYDARERRLVGSLRCP